MRLKVKIKADKRALSRIGLISYPGLKALVCSAVCFILIEGGALAAGPSVAALDNALPTEANEAGVSEFYMPDKGPHPAAVAVERASAVSFAGACSQRPCQSLKPFLSVKAGPAHEAEKIDVRAELYAASAYVSGGDYYSAIKVYRDILGARPRSYRVMNQIAFLYIKLREWGRATDFISRGLELRHDHVPLLINAGIVSAELGNYDDGEKFLLKALAGEGGDRLVLQNLTALYEVRGDKAAALKYNAILKKLGERRGR